MPRSQVPEREARPGGRRPSRAERQAQLRRRRRRSLAVFTVLAVLAAAVLVHRSAPLLRTAASTRPAAVHFSAGISTCTFTDATRSTYSYLTGKTTAGRVIPTEIRYPTLSPLRGLGESPGVHPALRHGPYPLIVFAEGYNVSPSAYAKLLDTWVRAGFVVAAPRFPDTDAAAISAQHGVDTESDDVNQPGDVGFVVRSIASSLAARGAGCPILRSLLQPGKVALAGQSDGAETVGGLAYDKRYLEAGLNLQAVAVLSGQAFGALATAGPDTYLPGPPLLISQSATDACNPPQLSTQLYGLIHQSDKWFLAIHHAYHLPPYSGTDPAAFAVVAAVTTRFFSLEFAGEQPGAGFVTYSNRSPGVASLSTGPTAPALAPLTGSSAACYYGI